MFSDDPKLGFFAQRDKFQAALDQGDVVAPAKSLDDMQSVVTNSTVDGILAALFAVLIVIVIADAARVWVRAIRARRPLPTTEVAVRAVRARRAGGTVLDRRGARDGARRGARRPLHARGRARGDAGAR